MHARDPAVDLLEGAFRRVLAAKGRPEIHESLEWLRVPLRLAVYTRPMAVMALAEAYPEVARMLPEEPVPKSVPKPTTLSATGTHGATHAPS